VLSVKDLCLHYIDEKIKDGGTAARNTCAGLHHSDPLWLRVSSFIDLIWLRMVANFSEVKTIPWIRLHYLFTTYSIYFLIIINEHWLITVCFVRNNISKSSGRRFKLLPLIHSKWSTVCISYNFCLNIWDENDRMLQQISLKKWHVLDISEWCIFCS
jgi:hypothetical protein